MSVPFDALDATTWPVLMTLQEVADVLRTTAKRVRGWTQDGTLPFTGIPSGKIRRLVPREAVLKITSGRLPTAQERAKTNRAPKTMPSARTRTFSEMMAAQ